MESFDSLQFTQPQNSSWHHKMPKWHVTTAINAILYRTLKDRKAIILCFFEIDKVCKKDLCHNSKISQTLKKN